MDFIDPDCITAGAHQCCSCVERELEHNKKLVDILMSKLKRMQILHALHCRLDHCHERTMHEHGKDT